MNKPKNGTWRTLLLVLVLELREKEASEDLLPGLLIHVRLEGQHGLGLVLREPDGLQVQAREGDGEELESIPGDVQDVELGAVPQFVGKVVELVLPEGEDVQSGQLAYLHGQLVEPVTVHVQVGQLGQVPNGRGQLREEVLRQDQLLEGYASAEEEGRGLVEDPPLE